MQDLLYHIKSISEQLNALTTSSSKTSLAVSLPKTTLESLKQSVADTLRLFVHDHKNGDDQNGDDHDACDLDLGPTTPPVDDVDVDVDVGPDVVSPRKRKRTSTTSTRLTTSTTSTNLTATTTSASATRNSARVAERCLPDCLRALSHPTISGYKNTKISSFMAANIMVMNLQRLQPRAEIVAMISRGAVLLHEALLCEPGILEKAGKGDAAGLASLTAAAFWIVAKFGGVRSLTPDANLVAMTAGIHADQLFAAEVMVLNALKWDICGALRKHDHLDVLVA